MAVDGWLFFGFVVCLALLAFLHRKRLAVQKILGPLLYIAMYRSKVGVGLMKRIANRFERPLVALTPFIIFVGFVGMVIVSFEIVLGLYHLLLNPASSAGVALVLPIKAKGIFFVPFLYWIISIFVVVLVHEGAHGVLALAHHIRVKSSGLAALGIVIPVIPAAFVEPDEKALQKKPAKAQLGVFAAGPFANIALAFMILAVSLIIFNPIVEGFYEKTGVTITKFADGDVPIKSSGVKEGDIVTAIDSARAVDVKIFSAAIKKKKPGESISLTTNKGTFSTTILENKDQKGAPYLGVFVEQSQHRVVTGWWVSILEWFHELLFWLVAMNVGVGLFNLLPLGIVDGGRMLHVALKTFFHENHANRAWVAVSGFFFIAVVGSILVGVLK